MGTVSETATSDAARNNSEEQVSDTTVEKQDSLSLLNQVVEDFKKKNIEEENKIESSPASPEDVSDKINERNDIPEIKQTMEGEESDGEISSPESPEASTVQMIEVEVPEIKHTMEGEEDELEENSGMSEREEKTKGEKEEEEEKEDEEDQIQTEEKLRGKGIDEEKVNIEKKVNEAEKVHEEEKAGETKKDEGELEMSFAVVSEVKKKIEVDKEEKVASNLETSNKTGMNFYRGLILRVVTDLLFLLATYVSQVLLCNNWFFMVT